MTTHFTRTECKDQTVRRHLKGRQVMTAEDVADFFSTTPVKISRNPKLHERQRLQLTPLARNGFRLLSAACAPVDCAGRVVVLVDADVDPEGVQEVEHVLVRGQV